MTTPSPSLAHAGDPVALNYHPSGAVPWREAIPPDLPSGRTIGLLRGCQFCGSMHPADLAAAIRAGASGHLADFKYKAYFDGVPNPHVGLLESRSSHSHPPQSEIDAGLHIQIPDGFDRATGAPVTRWTGAGTPAAATTHGKFYTLHLKDATPEDRDTIVRHLGLRAFDKGEQDVVGAACTKSAVE